MEGFQGSAFQQKEALEYLVYAKKRFLFVLGLTQFIYWKLKVINFVFESTMSSYQLQSSFIAVNFSQRNIIKEKASAPDPQ